MHAIDTVYHLVEPLHLLELFGIDVKQILLDGRVWPDVHHDDTSLLILVALPINGLQNIRSSLRDGNGRAARRKQPFLLKVPVLCKVFTEGISIEEYTYR